MATDYEFEMRWDGGQKIILPIKTDIDEEPQGCNWIYMDEEEIIRLLDGYEENEIDADDSAVITQMESLTQSDHTSGYFYDVDDPDTYIIRRITWAHLRF